MTRRRSRSRDEMLPQELLAALEAIAHGRHGDPFSVLGLHSEPDGALSIRVFLPDAERVWIVPNGSKSAAVDLSRLLEAGVFYARLRRKTGFAYRLRVEAGGETREIEDPYRFGPLLGEMDIHLFCEGRHLRLYDMLGAHPRETGGVAGTAFAVWAPNAERVSVVGNFNGWDGRIHPMRCRREAGVWEIFLPGVGPGALYKYEILGAGGRLQPLKADPLAFAAELRPATASVVHGLPRHDWSDRDWLAEREARQARDAPMSIYEVHLGSWMRRADGGWLSYDELARSLIPYAVEMGFTHLELLPVTEHPFDGSWGYQPTGLFAPTCRFGTPEDFAGFVDAAHRAGLGVILDWVPGHFPADAHGLARFDGTHLYEHEDPRKGFHRDWNTLIYNFGRNEVDNFLLASALFWLKEYHIDGLRVDAVASMLYLDYSREPGEWVPNRHGGNENLEAVALLKRINETCYAEAPGSQTIAEESTAWPGVSRPTYAGGLGFGYKWNLGWMNDTLAYMSKEPAHRRHHHGDIPFGLVYAFSETFILPLSHDEVVHGKRSILGRMPGDRWQRFANLRAYYGFMFAHPGKKLLFMGGEIGQEREWSEERALDWHLLDRPEHTGVQALIRDLNRLYRHAPALYVHDAEPAGFEWLVDHDAENSVYAFLRKGREGNPLVVAVCNFTPLPRHGYRIGVPLRAGFHERINTDAAAYGGSGVGNFGFIEAGDTPAHGQPFSLDLTLPPLATLLLEAAAPAGPEEGGGGEP